MTYQTEFPDYPEADMPPIPAGFADRSWHNDHCPIFMHDDAGLVLVVDYLQPDRRALSDAVQRFALIQCANRDDEAGWQLDDEARQIFECENWEAMEAAIARALAE